MIEEIMKKKVVYFQLKANVHCILLLHLCCKYLCVCFAKKKGQSTSLPDQNAFESLRPMFPKPLCTLCT